ncbi:hypothetical protein ACS41U_20205 [Salmonella enterica]|nr:hypothetical protein [Salmonella enterica]
MLGGADNANGELPSYITGANNVGRQYGVQFSMPVENAVQLMN